VLCGFGHPVQDQASDPHPKNRNTLQAPPLSSPCCVSSTPPVRSLLPCSVRFALLRTSFPRFSRRSTMRSPRARRCSTSPATCSETGGPTSAQKVLEHFALLACQARQYCLPQSLFIKDSPLLVPLPPAQRTTSQLRLESVICQPARAGRCPSDKFPPPPPQTKAQARQQSRTT
jgi:hypothetical protein